MMKNSEIKTEYKKNPASLQNRFCYTGAEIKEYINGTVLPAKRAEISLHLNIEKCSRCRQLFTLIASNNCKAKSIEDFDGKDQNITLHSPTPYTPTEQKIFERIKNRKKNDRIELGCPNRHIRLAHDLALLLLRVFFSGFYTMPVLSIQNV